MNIVLHHRHSGLSLLCAILVFVMVIIIGATIISIIIKIINGCLPGGKGGDSGGSTNSVTSPVQFQSPSNAMPVFVFPEIPAMSNTEPDRPLGDTRLFIERSTNLIDWQPGWEVTNESDLCICNDTNPPAPQAFYRAVLRLP